MFTHRLEDEDSLVVVFARESDRDFEHLPIVKSHLTTVGIVQGREVLEISYWDSGNTDEVLAKALDYLVNIIREDRNEF